MVNNDEETGLISYIGKIFPDNRNLNPMRNCSGKKYTKIQYDQSLYQWNISVANNPRISAVSYSDVSTMVIGTSSPPHHQDQNTLVLGLGRFFLSVFSEWARGDYIIVIV